MIAVNFQSKNTLLPVLLLLLYGMISSMKVPHPYEIVNLQKQYQSILTIVIVFIHFTYGGIR